MAGGGVFLGDDGTRCRKLCAAGTGATTAWLSAETVGDMRDAWVSPHFPENGCKHV